MDAGQRRRELAEEEDRAWAEFHELVESFSPEELETPGPGHPDEPEGWSVRDLLAHVGGWQAEAARVLRQIREGTYRPGSVDPGALNRELLRAGRALPAPVVRAEVHAARNQMLLEWSLLPEPTLEAEDWFVECGARHYAEHLDWLRRRARGGAP